MYLSKSNPIRGYHTAGGHHASRGDFLILMRSRSLPILPLNFRACIRKVAMDQLGHFMIGCARIGKTTVTLSGAYGADGLPVDIEHTLWETYGHPVPEELYQAWNTGGGWNGCGTERESFDTWAKQNLKKLKGKHNGKT